MSKQEVLPNIIWKVDSLWGSEKKCSDVLTFLGMSWKLKLLYLPETGGVKMKLMLKRLSAATVSQDANFEVDTSLLKQYGSGEFFRQNLSTSLGYREWCVWSQLKADVEKAEHVYHRNCIVFLVVITPGDKWVTLLQNTGKKSEWPDTPEIQPCLRSLTDNLDQIFDSDVHSDVVLTSGSREFRVHKAILSARSEVFCAMFRCDMRENREGSVNVTDVEPEVLEQFLRYLYTADVPGMDAKSARRLHAVADKYAVEALKMRCAFAVMDSYRSGVETQIPRMKPNSVTYITEAEKVDLRKKELTKALLMSTEWKILSQEFPHLVADMCAPLMQIVEEEPTPAAEEESPLPATTE